MSSSDDFVVSSLSTSSTSTMLRIFLKRRQARQNMITDISERMKEISAWPTVVPNDIVLLGKLLMSNCLGPLVCCACGLERKTAVDIVLTTDCNSPLDFSLLRVRLLMTVQNVQMSSLAIINAILDTTVSELSSKVVLSFKFVTNVIPH